jgi:(p)ppGpp synthase/HD superfamily hydrolase
MKNNYDKMAMSLRYWLLGKEWHQALKAMEFAAKFHKGTRKDGITKEFEHQIFQAHIVRTYYKMLQFPELTMIVIFLHDLMEDYDISREEIVALFGEQVAVSVERMTKVYRGVKKDNKVYYTELAEDIIASVAKIIDRLHNLSSMDGVFTLEKQESYIVETEELVMPLIKAARRNFPEQELVYEALKIFLRQQISLYRSMHNLLIQTHIKIKDRPERTPNGKVPTIREQEIIDMLNDGYTYIEIQTELKVAPRDISDTKKIYPELVNTDTSRTQKKIRH